MGPAGTGTLETGYRGGPAAGGVSGDALTFDRRRSSLTSTSISAAARSGVTSSASRVRIASPTVAVARRPSLRQPFQRNQRPGGGILDRWSLRVALLVQLATLPRFSQRRLANRDIARAQRYLRGRSPTIRPDGHTGL